MNRTVAHLQRFLGHLLAASSPHNINVSSAGYLTDSAAGHPEVQGLVRA